MERKEIFYEFVIWLTGAILYFMLEIMVRGYSHVSMFLCGGTALVILDMIWIRLKRSRIKKYAKIFIIMFAGTNVITLLEYITGLIVNIKYGLEVWNYSELKYNYRGQICLMYSVIWALMSIVCVMISDFLRSRIIE